ncbi:MAG TPA: DNA polymerase III subunit delta' [Agitococcus sp.]|nr:DNA polymerase III subunit delta' [Agitococcus sp.]HMX99354.1 DNA polymerase III subunit delta' [Agitococcus sp.]HMY28065.1 DNA polymerase III subunit delta' [Agitococcus sp.]HMY82141.1 DNA polymerase III subunit delta' [Agitococcus sp.]HNC02346.1 DNA polymerase III subunit delta' [Agitococcus sp.]
MNTVYPWQQAIWQILVQSRARQTLPHAFIFSGVQGVGLFEFSQVMSAWLLCQQPQSDGACGVCKSCQLWQAQSHPDYRLVAQLVDDKGKTSQVIKVDQIRELLDFLNKSAQLNGYRVAVIHHADTLNTNAANSLLKNLEEAGKNTAIILLTEQPLSLLATIRSRCQQFNFVVPDLAQAKVWLGKQLKQAQQADLLLALSAGAPLAALALQDQSWLEQRHALAKAILAVLQQKQTALLALQSFHKQLEPEQQLKMLQLLFSDVLFSKLGQQQAIKNSDLLPIINSMAECLSAQQIIALQQQCLEGLRLIAANIQANLILENLWFSLRVA